MTAEADDSSRGVPLPAESVEAYATYTTEQAAAELGVPANLVSQWHHRRKIHPVDYITGTSRSRHVPLYRLEELKPLAAAYHSRRAKAQKNS